MITLFDKKTPIEVVPTIFDFSLSIGSATISTATVTATRNASESTGVDASPEDIIYGAASISGGLVSQRITGGVAEVMYDLFCTANLSDGTVLTLSAKLPVEAT